MPVREDVRARHLGGRERPSSTRRTRGPPLHGPLAFFWCRRGATGPGPGPEQPAPQYVVREVDLHGYRLGLLLCMSSEQARLLADLPALDGVTAEDRAGLLADLEELALLLLELGTDWRQAYLDTMQWGRAVAELAQQQASLVAAQRERTVHLAVETPPKNWLHLGWANDDPA